MTMVQVLRNRAKCSPRVAGTVTVTAILWLQTALASAAQPAVHYHHAGIMPPGAIGSQQLMRGGPLPGYFQPVEIKAPKGSLVSTASQGQFDSAQQTPFTVGMLIGEVYRLRVTNIPGQEGIEVYPTIEVIDRLYPPIGKERHFPIPVELAQEDLELAAQGKFVTRVVYLEEPQAALPTRLEHEQTYFEAPQGENPLDVADTLGRPMAILRLGARVPDISGPDEQFLYGSPPLVRFPVRVLPAMAKAGPLPRALGSGALAKPNALAKGGGARK